MASLTTVAGSIGFLSLILTIVNVLIKKMVPDGVVLGIKLALLSKEYDNKRRCSRSGCNCSHSAGVSCVVRADFEREFYKLIMIDWNHYIFVNAPKTIRQSPAA